MRFRRSPLANARAVLHNVGFNVASMLNMIPNRPCTYHRIYINPVVSDGEAMMQQMTLRDGKSIDGIHVEPFQKLVTSHIAICDVN